MGTSISNILLLILVPIQAVNNVALRIAKSIAVTALALMVLIILLQVFFRYVLNNALPWPDEAARFLMLWMTGLIAPAAYRQGGFVAIDMLEQFLPRAVAAALTLVLLALSLLVLVMGVQLGINHVNAGWLFSSASLKIPLDWIGLKAYKIKLAWMYMSLLVGLIWLTVVNIELILRNLVTLFGHADRLQPIPNDTVRID